MVRTLFTTLRSSQLFVRSSFSSCSLRERELGIGIALMMSLGTWALELNAHLRGHARARGDGGEVKLGLMLALANHRVVAAPNDILVGTWSMVVRTTVAGCLIVLRRVSRPCGLRSLKRRHVLPRRRRAQVSSLCALRMGMLVLVLVVLAPTWNAAAGSHLHRVGGRLD